MEPFPPPDPVAQARTGHLTNVYNQTLSGLQHEENRARQEYGFDDPSSPFNRARMLQRSYEQAQAATTNSMAARGQLYSGALGTAQNENRFGYDRAVDSTRRSYDDILQQIAQRRVAARTALEGGTVEANADALSRALAQRADPETLAPVIPEPPPEAPVTPGPLTPAQRRAARQRMGLTDTRTATPAQIRRARRMGLL